MKRDRIEKDAETRGRVFPNRLGYCAILLLLVSGCVNDEVPEEQPTFTRERPSFTADRSVTLDSPLRFTDITEEAGLTFIR